MSIRRLTLFQFLLLLVLLFVLFGGLGALVWTRVKITQAEERRFRSVRLADQLRQSSDDLTRMARLYTVTGDEHYRTWFHEILAIREGKQSRPERYDLIYWDLVHPGGQRPRPDGEEVALEDLMLKEGITPQEIRKLSKAKGLSDDLVELEETAMNAIQGRFLDKTGNFTREAEPDHELARGLMFGSQYMEAKDRIMTPINEFLLMIEERTSTEVAVFRRQSRMLGALALLTLAVAVLVTLWILRFQRRRVLVPLAKVRASAEAVAAGNFHCPIEHESADEMGQLVGTFNEMLRSMIESIEALEEANTALTSANADLETQNAELDAFTATVSHDLKSPLVTIKGFLGLLKHDVATGDATRITTDIGQISKGADKMSTIIDELLLLAKIKKTDVERARLDMGQIVHEALRRLAPMCEEKQAEIIVSEHWLEAWGYAPWIEEVWVNYISNALKYGGASPRIEIGATPVEAGMVRFWIRDNGRGLTPEEQTQLFVPFVRMSQTNVEGHGLGLSIVHRIIDKLGGEVGVESEGVPGQGSLFSFTLPAGEPIDERPSYTLTGEP